MTLPAELRSRISPSQHFVGIDNRNSLADDPQDGHNFGCRGSVREAKIMARSDNTSADLHEFERARLALARLQVAGGDFLKDTFESISETASAALNVERVGIWLFVQGRRAIRCYDVYQRSRHEHAEGAILYAADFPEYFRSLEEQRSIAAVEAASDPRTGRLKDAYLAPLGITSMLDAPVYRNGQIVGVVCHEHVGTPRTWSSEDRDFAVSTADAVALKIESAALQDSERERQSLEASIADIRKLDAVGRLAAVVAHDLKNMLTVIFGGAQMISAHRDATPPIREMAGQIFDAANRGNELATELMSLGRIQQQRPSIVDVAAAVESMLPMLRTATGERHPVRCQRQPAPGLVMIDSAQFERAMMNLVINARDALPDGGAITISVATTEVSDGPHKAGAFVTVEVRDEGVGMSAETKARIFEPFFTTKPKGKGTGLGLPIVHRAVDRAGGFIHVASEIGQGTSIRLYFPRIAHRDAL
jgi:two-component system cell cycle sensor histidine kinase/response regulator CckA